MSSLRCGPCLGMLGFLSVFTGCGTGGDEDPHAEDEPHWSYSGTEGPEYWGELSEEYAACKAGEFQSPVDFPEELPKQSLDHLAFDYLPSPATLVDNGHTIVVNFDEQANELLVDGKAHTLLQFHFHADSEHQVEGKAAPLEMHLVHQASDGGLAVVGIFFEEGDENEALAEVFSSMEDASEDPSALESVDLGALLPNDEQGWTYSGSLTTPPCSEGVKWNVFARPLEVSKAQLEVFTDIHSGSNRPVQENEDVEEQVAESSDDEGES